MSLEWDEIHKIVYFPNDEVWQATYRAKVPGGWLVRFEQSWNYSKKGDFWEDHSQSITFMADENHIWEV